MEDIQDYGSRRFITVEARNDPDRDTVVIAMDLPRRKLIELDRKNAQLLVSALRKELGDG